MIALVETLIPVGTIVGVSDGVWVGVFDGIWVGVFDGVCVGLSETIFDYNEC